MSYPRFNSKDYKKKSFVLDGENTIYPYGKYSGSTLKEIFERDLDYFLWLENNNSIEGLNEIIEQIKLKNQIVIFSKLNEISNKLDLAETLIPFIDTEFIIGFEKNLQIYTDPGDQNKELFAYYKYYISDNLVFNIIFSKYKKFSYQGYNYSLPTDDKGNAKRIKGINFKLVVEPREPYLHKNGKKMVQNLIVKSFTKI